MILPFRALRISAITAALAGMTLVADAQWLAPGFDAAYTYANDVETTLTPKNVAQLRQAWRAHLENDANFAVRQATEAGGRLFVCEGKSLHAIVSATGEPSWTQQDLGADCGIPSLAGSTAFVPLSRVAGEEVPSNGMAAYDQATGELQWRSVWPAFESDDGTFPPAIADGRLFVSDWTQNVKALDAATGEILWSEQTSPATPNREAVTADGRVFVATFGDGDGPTPSDPGIYAFDAASGALLWSHLVDACWIENPVLVLGGRVFSFPCGGPVLAQRASDGRVLWEGNVSSGPSAPLVGHGDTIFVATSYALSARDAATGAVRWRRELEWEDYDRLITNLAWANGMLFALVDKGPDRQVELRVFDAETGKTLTRRHVTLPPLSSVYATGLVVAAGRVQISYYVESPHGVEHNFVVSLEP